MPKIDLGQVKGAKGDAATIQIGTVSTGAAGTNAAVTNVGTAQAAVFNFVIPQGAAGSKGDTGSQGPKGDPGTNGNDGAAATIQIGTVQTGAPGSNASVTNSGTPAAAVLNFVIPRGDTGLGTIPDDSITGRSYIVGANNAELYVRDNQSTPVEKKIPTLTLAHTWSETVV